MKIKSLLFSAISFIALACQSEAALLVNNGNFSDLTGLTPIGGGWYDGVPSGWTGSPGNYSVLVTGSGVWANVGSLVTVTPWNPLHQDVGTVDSTGPVTLTFNMPSLAFSSPLTAVIYDTSDSALSAVTSITTTGVHQITTTSDVSAGTAIRISFWGSGALTDVSIAAVPEPSTWALAALGGLVLVVAVRRRNCLAS